MLRKFLTSFLKDTGGASAPEYAILLAVIGSVVIIAAQYLGQETAGQMNDTGTCIATDGATCP